MTRSSAPRRDFAAMEERRRRAARLFAADKWSQAEIARELHISRQSVSRWFEAWRQDKPNWIRGAGRAGRRPKLDEAQLKQVDKALRQGAQAHGFGTDLDIAPRGGGHRAGHGGSLSSRPCVEDSCGPRVEPATAARQARERNGEARRRWVAKRRPAVKKTPGDAEPGFSLRTKAGSRNGRR